MFSRLPQASAVRMARGSRSPAASAKRENSVTETTILSDGVQYLKGVGPGRAELLAKLHVHTVGDLIYHFPRSYDDLTNVAPMDNLEAGVLQTVQGEVVEIEGKELADGRRVTQVVISDPKGKCLAGIWFNSLLIVGKVKYGQMVAFSGKPKWYREYWTMHHPRVQVLGDEGARLEVVPVYPLTDGLRPDALRAGIRSALEKGAGAIVDTLPEPARMKHRYPPVAEALWQVHFPEALEQGIQARRRFIYEEFLILQVALAVRRRSVRDQKQAPRLATTPGIDAHIRKLFPFKLTGDQDKAIAAITKDLASDRPMQRLLQADVGAGKTAVAIYAMLVAIANKQQAIIMAPTEVLAQQHWRTLEQYLANSRVRRALLTGGLSQKERGEILWSIKNGVIDLVVGTQALISENVEFAKLAVVVIDEQHKFGVSQRARVKKLGVDPHYLVMTATPIPRTIALSVFGDLDTSTIRELPPGRQRVLTRWQTETQRDKVYQRFAEEMKKGRQAFIVCPLVAESETLDLTSATELYDILRTGPFKEFRIGLLHGQLPDDEKARVMADFRDRKLDLLVSTVVIEVGIDVPNATLMIVEHADRFGLSQLHQLRGRVTRGTVAGECYLFAGVTTEEARMRLRAISRTTDGFALAEEDARLRGLGEFFGTRQHGLGDLRFGDLLEDFDLLELARADAIEIVSADAGLRKPEHAALRSAVLARYGQSLDLAAIG
jgi:ATP-dependent DNA helicase RecG